MTGAEVWLKFENLQFTAAYKERGALNRFDDLSSLSTRNGIFGGKVAAPAFADIGSWYAKTYNVTPDKPVHASP